MADEALTFENCKHLDFIICYLDLEFFLLPVFFIPLVDFSLNQRIRPIVGLFVVVVLNSTLEVHCGEDYSCLAVQ